MRDRNDDILILPANVGNYYGYPTLRQSADGRYFLHMENYDDGEETRVTEEFARAWIDEFKQQENPQ